MNLQAPPAAMMIAHPPALRGHQQQRKRKIEAIVGLTPPRPYNKTRIVAPLDRVTLSKKIKEHLKSCKPMPSWNANSEWMIRNIKDGLTKTDDLGIFLTDCFNLCSKRHQILVDLKIIEYSDHVSTCLSASAAATLFLAHFE